MHYKEGVTLIWILILHITTVYGIKCFQCNSVKDPGCSEITTMDTNSTYLRACDEVEGKSSFCRKTKITLLTKVNHVRIYLECARELYRTNQSECYNVDTDFKYEVNCQCFEDACNHAHQRTISAVFPILLAFGSIAKLLV